MAISLDEVTIQARSIIEKGDRKVILPTQNQLKMSSSGIDLLGKLQLPRITVDIMSGEITTSGNGEVQLRINGVRVTYTEISSLSPEDILRIEYHDTPGVRYGNAAAVIDYITKNKKAGGSVSGGAIHSLSSNRTSIDDMISGRYNYGKSKSQPTCGIYNVKETGHVSMTNASFSPTMNFIAWKPESKRCSIRNC
jgi:hypothetical protein